jgi:signal transduction histidine kinase
VPAVSSHFPADDDSSDRLTNGRTVDAISVPDFSANTPEGAPYIGSITDVTNQVASEVAIQRLSDQRVAEADQRRKDAIFQKEQQSLLVDVVSHELRNAINPILQSSLLIKNSLIMAHAAYKKGLDGDQVVPVTELSMQHMMEDLEACDAIIDSATQMERVANDVLGLAQIQLNQLDVTPVPFNLDTQIK